MAITEHQNFEEIRFFINSMLALIKARQVIYYNQNEKAGYFQGLKIPSQTILTGLASGSVDYGLHPSDQEDSWGTFLPDYFNAETRIPVNIAVQAYETPEGKHGWIFTATLRHEGLGPDLYGNDGPNWTWRHNEGPQSRSGVWDDWFCEPDYED